jgi:galactose mutarotase-like enzyme
LNTSISNAYLTAQINHCGAELISLKNNNGKEFLWEGNPDFWGKQSPVLFPIVGGLKNNTYHYNGVDYQMPKHGFAREMEFELIHQTSDSVIFSLKSSDETTKMYPFEFGLLISYTLENNSLLTDYTVVNHSECQMPFSIGAHPGFALSENFENYSLEFEKDELLESYQIEDNLISTKTEKVVLNDRQLPLNYQLFEIDALIFKKIQSKTLTLLENNDPLLKVSYHDFPHLGIWTMVNAPFLCIEPWFGYSDTIVQSGNIFEKESIQILEADQTFNSQYTIEVL